MNANEICVPEGALATDAEGGGNIAPGVGDEVDFTGRGKVTRAENGQVYIAATEINGAPVAGGPAGEAPGDGEEAALDDEVRKMSGGGGPAGGAYGGMLGLLLLLSLVFSAGAENLEFSRERTCTGSAVSNHVMYAKPTQGFSVEVNNMSGATLYLMVFDSATNQLVGATPHFTAVPVPTASVGGKDWSASGAPFRYGVNVCLSTTPFSLTNASAGGTATLIHSPVRGQ